MFFKTHLNFINYFKYGYAILYLLAQFTYVNTTFSNTKPDSLRVLLSKQADDNGKYIIQKEIAKQFWNIDKDSCSLFLGYALESAKRLNNTDLIIDASISLGAFHLDWGNFDEALNMFHKALELTAGNTSPTQMAKIFGGLGNCYSQKQNLILAINYYKKAIEQVEVGGNKNEMGSLYGRLGNLYYMNGSYIEAIDYYRKASSLFKLHNNPKGNATSIMNVGNCFKQIGLADTALIYYSDAYRLFKAIGGVLHSEGQCLANIGNIYVGQKRYNKAKQHLLSADSIFMITQNKSSISLISRDLAELYIQTGNFTKANIQIERGLKLSQESNYDYHKMSFIRLKWIYFDNIGPVDSAYKWVKKYMAIKDTIFVKERQENIDKLLVQFETEQKEKEIEILKQGELINQLKIKRKSLIQYFTFSGLVVIIVIAVSLFISVQRRKRINHLLTLQNAEINQQKEEILAQRDEIESQRDLLIEQKKSLEKFREHINDSLRYAQSIQSALLPSELILEQISNDYFLLLKPCEMVSGDFFWVSLFDEYQVFCVADCTGHGVPGAFMSILGVSALNNIVTHHRTSKASDILNFLRQSVIESLSQSYTEYLHKDGLDIGLCVYNTRSKELQFAGARIPLWIVSEELFEIEDPKFSYQFSENGYTLFELKADLQPVGLSPAAKPFSNTSIDLKNRNATLYLASDGFASQLDNDAKQKFGTNRLKKLIINNAGQSLIEQKNILEKTLIQWSGNHYQVDDITFLGINLNNSK